MGWAVGSGCDCEAGCDGDGEGQEDEGEGHEEGGIPLTRSPNTFINRSCPRCVPNRNPFGITRTRPRPNGSDA